MFRYFLLLVSLAAALLFAPLAYSGSAQLTVRDSVTRSPIAGAIVTEFGSGQHRKKQARIEPHWTGPRR
jgi:hypothetical protein